MPGGIKIGLSDYIIKIVGKAVTFDLITIALMRRFEKEYTHQIDSKPFIETFNLCLKPPRSLDEPTYRIRNKISLSIYKI